MSLIDILIIDDSPAFNKLTRRIFEKSSIGCTFSEVSNGRRALDYLASAASCPHVILLDMNMPVMDGFEFLDEYMKSHKCMDKTTIYMLSSSARDSDRDHAYQYPMIKAYFEKPLTPEHIRQILADITP